MQEEMVRLLEENRRLDLERAWPHEVIAAFARIARVRWLANRLDLPDEDRHDINDLFEDLAAQVQRIIEEGVYE
jgi:hypothetical protein